MKKMFLLLIMFLPTIYYCYAALLYYKYVTIKGIVQVINVNLWIVEMILIIVTCIRKRDINKKYALLFMIWTFYSFGSIDLFRWYVDFDDYWYIMHIPGVILGAIIVNYTIKVNFKGKIKTSKGEK